MVGGLLEGGDGDDRVDRDIAVSAIFTKLGLSPETAGHRRVRAVLTFLQSAPT